MKHSPHAGIGYFRAYSEPTNEYMFQHPRDNTLSGRWHTLEGAHAADAIALTDGIGMFQQGSPDDLTVVDVPRFEHVPYNPGVRTTETVIKAGKVVHRV